MKLALRIFSLLALLILAGSFVGGCKTPENSENESARPWNAPRQWETGLPGFSNERR